jgi:uncharacterized protein (TIGR03382 family)
MGLVAINVSFGDPSGGGPAATYAAAGAPGTWNRVTGIAGPAYTLVALDGTDAGVSMTQSPTTTLLAGGDASVTGDDAKLLESGLVTTGAETCLSFTGFAAGTYEVLIYAWVPNGPAVMSRTRQDEAPATKDIGGAWTGAHVEGVTYARYVVDVGSDGVLPAHSGLAPSMPSAALNGVQIRPLPAGGVDAGATGPDAGSIGETGDAGTTRHAGGGGCTTSGGSGGLALVALSLVARSRRRRPRRAPAP